MFKQSDINNFIKELKAGVWKVHSNAIEAVEEYLKLVEQTSQSYVPIDSGDLRDSFFKEIEATKTEIVGLAGYDKSGALEHYAKIMHSGYWPNDYWPEQLNHLNGQPINYHTDFQPTPKSHFLLRGFKENEQKLEQLLKGVFDGL